MKLRATKGLRYATRALQAGDEFEAGARDAKILKALGKAENAPVRAARRAAPAEEPERDEMAELRDEYERVVGRRPFNGWDAATLREKMAESRASSGSYARRDMRAED